MSLDSSAPRGRGLTIVLSVIAVLLLAAGGLAAFSYTSIASPSKAALGEDPRNSVFELRAHPQWFLNRQVLVLDLRSTAGAAPVDLARAIFLEAAAFADKGRHFRSVILASRGKPVFQIEGNTFASIGEDYGAGENPGYLVRKLPSQLLHMDGTSAYSEWEGGLLGVLSQEFEDLSDAMSAWAAGNAPN